VPEISAELFRTIFVNRLSQETLERNLKLLQGFSPKLSLDFTNLILLAAEQGSDKLEIVMKILEAHAKNRLVNNQKTASVVTLGDASLHKTRHLFLSLCNEVLGLHSETEDESAEDEFF